MDTIKRRLYDILAANQPMTVRQVFYRAVTRGIIPKTDAAYKTTVCRLLTSMRRSEVVPYGWIADSTRWQRKPNTHDSMGAALEETIRTYRRALWRDQHDYVEIWCEKDALASVLYPATEQWDVKLMVSRGFASVSFLYEAAQAIRHVGKPAYIYLFGDHDPSGVAIGRRIVADLRTFTRGCEVHFERVAVTQEQITRWSLPLRPTKRSDSRARDWEGGSVELDAIEPEDLRQLVETCIIQHIDPIAFERAATVEQLERETTDRYRGAFINLVSVASGVQ